MTELIDVSEKIEKFGDKVNVFLPDIHLPEFKTQKPPKFVFTDKCYNEFKFFVKNLTKYFLVREYSEIVDRNRCSEELRTIFELTPQGAIKALLFISQIHPETKIPAKFLIDFKKNLLSFFTPIREMKALIILDFEITVGNLRGYPDIIWVKNKNIGILEIKVEKGNLSNISACAGLFREKGFIVNYFGFYYPLGTTGGYINAVPNEWNHLELLNLLSSE